ncbi:sensor histidine kinase [Paenibacillus sp. DMB20]|uniref:sensor histidine kinase n=1 Tax=Paenibacillus sp. DMB20 TaxID=1642570 RepID=UPI000627DB90|nr:HAMP domain-containing sensor histidine kinase [Paenibacillus sp. DMB20]KKO52551.1 histidine kinase [Paenibacillus sp. DMB20]
MKKSIVFKLFLLTTALCLSILAVLFVGQTVFFKQFYVNKKASDIQRNLVAFENEYAKHRDGMQSVSKLEHDFFRKHNTWITTLDKMGSLRFASDFELQVKILPSNDAAFSRKTISVPLYGLTNIEEVKQGNPFLQSGEPILIQGLKFGTAIIPYRLGLPNGDFAFENSQIAKKAHEIIPSSKPPSAEHSEFPSIYLYGTITKSKLLGKEDPVPFVYTNHVFMEQIKEFQADLLLNPRYGKTVKALKILNVEKNGIPYKVFIKPIRDPKGGLTYIFAMTSLQPVDEAILMIQEYYVYLLIFALLLILLVSFYYSKRIAQPLLRINRTTQKIAELDFSEKVPIKSVDEIGDLSRNINELSDKLHSHIERLEQDIAKEKQLERTRKEFISGVSHELKTPLSVIQGCLSILKDGVASQKKDYYFDAMINEVKKMDLLIVDMLELAKFESGTYNLNMDSFCIDALIEQVCEVLTLEVAEKQLQINLRLHPVQVVANERRIEQVLVNFITNAIRYSPAEGSITITTIEESARVKINVENKGAAIHPEHLEKIWDRFYRAEPSRHRATGGTGLGLAICKKILEMHHVPYGVINTDEGVMFYFYLNKQAQD